MEHELVDHLSANGKFIGTVDKAIAHQFGLWHRSIHLWIVNDQNEILLQKRCANKKFYPNVYDCSVAGHVGATEETWRTAIRESKEELGVDIDIKKDELELLFTIREQLCYHDIDSREFVDVYLLRKNVKLSDLTYQEEEVSGAKYVPLKEFFSLIEAKDPSLFMHTEEYEKLKEFFGY